MAMLTIRRDHGYTDKLRKCGTLYILFNRNGYPKLELVG
jgi:hypothetical protein